MKKITLVMPVYNEQDCIMQVVQDWYTVLEQRFAPEDFTLLVVDDGSKDNTAAYLQAMRENYPSLYLLQQKNAGHGMAVMNGYKKALEMKSEYVFQVDSDNQFEAKDFDLLWQKRFDSPFILGQRKIRHDAFVRLIITRIVILINLFLFFVYIPDANIPYRLMRGEFLARLLHRMPFNTFIPNIFLSVLAKKQKVALLSIPVQHKERKTGTVSILRWKLVKVCFTCTMQLIKLRWSLWLGKATMKSTDYLPTSLSDDLAPFSKEKN